MSRGRSCYYLLAIYGLLYSTLTAQAADIRQLKNTLIGLVRNDKAKPGANPYMQAFLDVHSQPKVQFATDTNQWYTSNLNIDNRHEFKPPLRKAPFQTTGEPWPMPKLYTADHEKVLKMNMATFRIKVLNNSCDILTDAIKRYTTIITTRVLEEPYDFVFNYNIKTHTDRKKQMGKKYKTIKDMGNLEIVVKKNNADRYPHINMDESYNLTVKEGVTYLIANEVWGALRGMETFSQLLFRKSDTNEIYSKATVIEDAPRFPHRGILLDTSRHFMHKYVIKNVLDGMSYNKLNVLHWHIIDDNSFPYKSEVYPKLSEKGAFHPTLVYTLDDIRELVEYARLRGIRVVPEIDSPGHTFSWLGYPEIKSTCYQSNGEPIQGPMGPINPATDETYNFMSNLFSEIFDVFPDTFSHLGGDELHSSCWATNPSIRAYLAKNAGIPENESRNPTNYVNLAIGYYFKRLIATLKETGKRKKRPTSFIMWEDVLKNTKEVPKDSILQVWYGKPTNVRDVNQKGYKALYSSCWYFDNYQRGVLWPKYYSCEPSPYFTDAEEKGKLLGGEACLWAEYITTETLMTMMWPRASVPAERLWSPRNVKDFGTAAGRLQEQRCRMIYRGLPTGHISGPDYCLRYNDQPLGGEDPLGLYSNETKRSDSINYSVEAEHRMSLSYLSNYNQYLPVVNIIVSMAGVYLILMASRCMRRRSRDAR